MTLAAAASGAVTGANVRISTDNAIPIQSAIDALPTIGGTVYFPFGGTYTSGSSSYVGNYYIGTGLTVSQPGIKLVGECGEPGNSGNNVNASNCSTLIADKSLVMLTVQAGSGSLHSGLTVEDLGFEDVSTNGDQVTGGLHLVQVYDFNLTSVRIQRITTGYGIQFDGGSDATQFGVVVSPSIANTKIPIQTKSNTSEINFFGGNVGCQTLGGSPTQITGSIGMDLGSTSGNTGNPSAGEWGVYGTHILDCATGVSMKDVSVLQWYGVAEITIGTKVGTGFLIDSDTHNSGGNYIGGSISNFSTGIQVQGSNTFNTIIGASVSNNGTGVFLTGSSVRTKILGSLDFGNTTPLSIDSSVLPSTLIMANADYTLSSGKVGSQIPVDLTIPSTTPSGAPPSGSRRLYVDSSSGHLSALTSGSATVDLEAGLLNYQKAAANITGNSSDQTVYTFSLPSIPAGKGIRVKVWWTCSTCTGANKTFKWQFGSTVTPYAAITAASSNLAYSVVTIFNDPGSQTAQTMFIDTLLIGATNVTFGLTSNPAQNTSGAQSVTFLFNAGNTETITPKGFAVEAVE